MLLFDKYNYISYNLVTEAGAVESNSTIQAAFTQHRGVKIEQFIQDFTPVIEKLPQDTKISIEFRLSTLNSTDIPVLFTQNIVASNVLAISFQNFTSSQYFYAELSLLEFLKIILIRVLNLLYGYWVIGIAMQIVSGILNTLKSSSTLTRQHFFLFLSNLNVYSLNTVFYKIERLGPFSTF
jgi:hypothetical protein